MLWRRKALLIGPLLLAGLLAWTDPWALLKHLAGASLPLLAAAFLVSILETLTRAQRWRSVMSGDTRLGSARATRMYFAGFYWGGLTPGRVGELYKIKYLQQIGVPTGEAVASVGLDRVLDAVALIAAGALFLLATDWWRLDYSGAINLGMLGIAVTLGLLTAVVVILWRDPRRAERIDRLVKILGETWRSLCRLSHGQWLAAGLLTVGAMGFFVLDRWLIAMALGIEAPFTVVAGAVILAGLVSVLPLSVQGVGTRDAVLVVLLGVAGVAPELAIAFSSLILVMILASVGLGQIAAAMVEREHLTEERS
jgi:uncharacterized protein (TIRG00374 family)